MSKNIKDNLASILAVSFIRENDDDNYDSDEVDVQDLDGDDDDYYGDDEEEEDIDEICKKVQNCQELTSNLYYSESYVPVFKLEEGYVIEYDMLSKYMNSNDITSIKEAMENICKENSITIEETSLLIESEDSLMNSIQEAQSSDKKNIKRLCFKNGKEFFNDTCNNGVSLLKKKATDPVFESSIISVNESAKFLLDLYVAELKRMTTLKSSKIKKIYDDLLTKANSAYDCQVILNDIIMNWRPANDARDNKTVRKLQNLLNLKWTKESQKEFDNLLSYLTGPYFKKVEATQAKLKKAKK